jgi:predicted PurR-regulated permease PerM
VAPKPEEADSRASPLAAEHRGRAIPPTVATCPGIEGWPRVFGGLGRESLEGAIPVPTSRLPAHPATDSLAVAPDGVPSAPVVTAPVVIEGRASTPASRATRPSSGPSMSSSAALRTLTSLAVVAALYWGRGVLVPVALAALVAFLLSPIANAIEKLRVPRAVAATASVLVFTAGLLAVLWESGSQAVDFARRLPEYKKTLDEKFAALKSGGAASPIMEAAGRLKELEGRLTTPGPVKPPAPDANAASPERTAPSATPVPVRVVPDEPTPLDVYGELAGTVLGPLGDAAIVVLLAIFLLSNRMDVRERLLALGSARRIGVTSQALEEAGRRVARYLLSNLAVNVLYGTAVGVGVYLIGVPNAALWGLLCGLLRFVPYVGTWIGAVLPLAVSIAVFDGWGRTGAVFATILGIDVVVGNVVEPIVYGHRTGLSPLAVVLATVFWTWVWGIPGLLLAIPMTLCLAVVGRYIPGFGAFHVLLGDEPMLDPSERAYERLIAFDAAGASRVAAEVRKKVGAAAADDAVLLSVLRRAERDRREGQLDEERYLSICDGVREALNEYDAPEVVAADAPRVGFVGSVLCLPAIAETDRVACEMLVSHLGAAGISAEIGPTTTTMSDAATRAVRDGASAVCVVALPPFAALRVRSGIQRARSEAPRSRYIGVVLDPEADRARVESVLRQAGAAETKFSLADVVAALAPRPVAAAAPGGPDGTASKSDDSAPVVRTETRA